MKTRACIALAMLLLGCTADVDQPGASVHMDPARSTSLFDAPWPSDDLLRNGVIDSTALPDSRQNALVLKTIGMISGATGFPLAGAVYFTFSEPIDPNGLPDITASQTAVSPVFLMGIDPQAGDHLRRIPLDTAFMTDGGPFGAPNLLAMLPLQGFPLRPRTTYAAVVKRTLRDAKGRLLTKAAGIESVPMLAAALDSLGVKFDDVAGYTVFTTGDPSADIATVRADALSQPPPLPAAAPTLRATYPDYCLFQSTVKMPVYQRGTPPYTSAGGGWTFESGKPVLQRFEDANLFVTVPRQARPAAGWPTVVYIRAGGSGEVPLADRGVQATNGGPTTPGTGLAMHFAQVGWAAVEVDGPLGGLRNTTNADEQFTVFNVANPEALRDNVRQSAVELSALAQSIDKLTFDTSACADSAGGAFSVDLRHMALFGHSTGATIAPLALAIEPRFRAAVLSGAGGSWIENIVEKKKPVDVRPVAELLLGYTDAHRTLTRHDPVLTLFQWALEAADPATYARRVISEPDAAAPARHVLMIQGIVDHYIMPRIANTTSASLGLDLGGDALDESAPELASTPKAFTVLQLAGHGHVALPARGNHRGADGSQLTAVLTQHPEDGIEDGHEVLFQTEPPKRQVRCFLSTFAGGVPTVVEAKPISAGCP
jgi:hypothetical protein